MLKFSDDDLKQIKDHEQTLEAIEKQVAFFETSTGHLKLNRACTLGDGIQQIPETAREPYLKTQEVAAQAGRFLKMVPASGAATRMFKNLHDALRRLRKGAPNGEPTSDPEYARFLENLERFPFYAELKAGLASRGQELPPRDHHAQIALLEYLLYQMNYAQLPKGLLSFHIYEDGPRTPFEEHIREAEALIKDRHGRARLHFTISKEHEPAFKKRLTQSMGLYETEGFQPNIEFSVQKPSTDTLALTPKNEPFRNADGTLLFRPGGHGALIQNLNALQGDLVFLKNIDNIVPDRLRADSIHYQKVLAGYLITLQDQCFNYLAQLEQSNLSPAFEAKLLAFMREKLGFRLDRARIENREIKPLLGGILNRPLRVCGMVRNQGEPGGGPFWVDCELGESLQIVETSQISSDPRQQALLNQATHFNPVDLVCAVRDAQGNPFFLPDYVNEDTGFISQKTKDGKPLRALEHPGLWNGAMADWNTAFVEVPIETFNPVKTVNDLLRAEHQTQG